MRFINHENYRGVEMISTSFIDYFLAGVSVIYAIEWAGVMLTRTKKDYIFAILLWPVIFAWAISEAFNRDKS